MCSRATRDIRGVFQGSKAGKEPGDSVLSLSWQALLQRYQATLSISSSMCPGLRTLKEVLLAFHFFNSWVGFYSLQGETKRVTRVVLLQCVGIAVVGFLQLWPCGTTKVEPTMTLES